MKSTTRWVMLPEDLNRGAGNNWFAVMINYNGIYKQDLNEGSGGWYIYLYYTRDPIFEE